MFSSQKVAKMGVPYKIVSDFGIAVKNRRLQTEINGLAELSATNPWDACYSVSKLLHKTAENPTMRCKVFAKAAAIVPALSESEPASLPYMLKTLMPVIGGDKSQQKELIEQCASVAPGMLGRDGWQTIEMVSQILKHTGDKKLVAKSFNVVSQHDDIQYFPELSGAFASKAGATKKTKKKQPAQTAGKEKRQNR